VGVHEGSALSPLQFIIALEALSRKCRGRLLLELLYADDLVLITDTEELLVKMINNGILPWKRKDLG